ncbi:MAG: polysaccharide biosynthesis protein [Clostridia bacterium]|nr:polysaccharide biosynthesis protein [Clostridia bacterium]
MDRKKVLGGAFVLGVGAFIAKVLGAVYRIPLTNNLGSYGIGLYQMVFPVYTLLLDFSGAGVPSAISRLIASNSDDKERGAYQFLSSSLRLLFILGGTAMVFMLLFALPLSKLQGDKNAYLGYVFLSPAVILFAIISCFRGYFQGLMNMKPTAISQIIEQGVKLIAGILLVRALSSNLSVAVGGATLAITLSEIGALIYLYVVYRRKKKKDGLRFNFDKLEHKKRVKSIIKTSIPITLMGTMLPLSHVIDSFMVVNVIGGYRADATSLYGLLSGVVHTILNLPVAICYGISSVTIPTVSSASGIMDKRKNAKRTLWLTFGVSLLGAIACFIFSPTAIRLFFRGLSVGEKQTAVNLVRLTAVTVILLSVIQTSNAVLVGMGKLYAPIFSLGSGIALKSILSFVLMKIPFLNVYGSAIATIACYFFVCLVNLILIFYKRASYESSTTQIRRSIG